MIFKIESSQRADPKISFDPGKAEVIGRQKGGVSISTTIINGRVSAKKEATYIYELVSATPGTIRITNIEVDNGGVKTKVEDQVINVGAVRKEPRSYFLNAEISNKNPFIGEGIQVNYYLYTRFSENIIGNEILKFPVLNHFIKRFQMPSNQIERIQKDGLIYNRRLIYAARLYPVKEGEINVDPLQLKIQYYQVKYPLFSL